ncbi:hypothetical protein STEG23_021226 [Scotinomys teguina]
MKLMQALAPGGGELTCFPVLIATGILGFQKNLLHLLSELLRPYESDKAQTQLVPEISPDVLTSDIERQQIPVSSHQLL